MDKHLTFDLSEETGNSDRHQGIEKAIMINSQWTLLNSIFSAMAVGTAIVALAIAVNK